MMDSDRCKIIINNLLTEIIEKTDICINDNNTYYSWLINEVGLTDAEIDELKKDHLFPEP